MTISIIVITANPTDKQYAWKESLASYQDLADEIIVVDGGTETLDLSSKARLFHIPDPEVWNWAEHAKRLNYGLEKATCDWIIKVDIDWVFNENDFKYIHEKLDSIVACVVTFQKKTFYPGMKYIEKGEVPIAISKEYKNKIRFGKDTKKYTDLTYPIYWNGEEDELGVPFGTLVPVSDWGRTGATVWNFDYTFKTIEKAKELFLRGSKAHREYFGDSEWGEDEEEAFQVFLNNMRGKTKRALNLKSLNELPKYIRSRIENLKPEEFGYNGWNLL